VSRPTARTLFFQVPAAIQQHEQLAGDVHC
jgi:hypothetical protein